MAPDRQENGFSGLQLWHLHVVITFSTRRQGAEISIGAVLE